jgi:hypothetical protein
MTWVGLVPQCCKARRCGDGNVVADTAAFPFAAPRTTLIRDMSCNIDDVREAETPRGGTALRRSATTTTCTSSRDAPEVSDAEYDELMRRLRAIEEHYPELITPESPTQRVGGRAATAFEPVEHRLPMLSLANAFNFGQLQAWHKRAANLAGRDDFMMVCEPKIDGAGRRAGLRGRRASRRGRRAATARRREHHREPEDGARSIPLALRGPDPGPHLEVRGEVYMPKSRLRAA